MNRTLWPMLTGFSLWALAFTGLYALQHLGCFWDWDGRVHRAVLIVGYLGALGLVGALLMWQMRAGVGITALALTVAALAASVIVFAPTLFVTLCI